MAVKNEVENPLNPKNKESLVYHLGDQHEGLTLAAALKELAKDASWGQVKKWISRRQIQVNGNLCLDEARRLTAKDVIKWFAQPQSKPVEVRDIRIEHLDEQLLVVAKPAGVTSVRHFNERRISTRRRQLQPTLEELLPPVLAKMQRLRWPPLPPVGMNRGRHQTNQARNRKKPSHIQNSKKLPPELQVFPVHRLDRETSGLMLFARTRAAEQKLVSMFRRHTIRRQYQAFCSGQVDPQTITSMLIRDRGDGVRGTLPKGASQEEQDAALEAITHILHSEPIAGSRYSKLTCKLETGRTHQIRIHLSELGHPICGDKIYHKLADGKILPDDSHAPRHALHSHLLEFTHPFSGEHLNFKMPLPTDLARWLKSLKNGS
ncbi:MAG: RluA family pseudouridine synthase [Planctomycetota bacterium]|nr:RluA family pseudouridine synthase [Planctomycetota bacterium]